jgi:hypothetical protein
MIKHFPTPIMDEVFHDSLTRAMLNRDFYNLIKVTHETH